MAVDQKIAVNVNELCEMLCIGKNKAYQVGADAGAVVKIGRRTLFNVEKIRAYINERSGSDLAAQGDGESE